MARSVFYIDVACGEPTLGLWCPSCLKPAGYEIRVYWLKDSGVSPFLLIRKCHDCGANLPREDVQS